MAWIIVLLLVLALLGSLKWSGKLSAQAFELALVAALIGVAGYAWQGSPSLPGHPVAAR